MQMKKFLTGAMGLLAVVALVAAIIGGIVLVDAGLLHLLGVRHTSFGWLIGYVLLAAVIGLPLELFTNGFARALFQLGWASRRMANFLYIPLDALCSALAFWGTDLLMDQVEANGLAILAVGLLSAIFSQPIEKVKQRRGEANEEDEDGGGPSTK